MLGSKKIKYVLFDLDGTLLYTLEDLQDSVNYILTKYGYPKRTLEQVTAAVGNGLSKLLERSLSDKPENFDEMVAEFREYYAAHSAIKTRPYEGIIEMLKELKSMGLHMACVTNKPQKAADVLYEKYFAEYLDFMQGENPPMPRKPDPAPIYAAMERLGAVFGECVYIGDSEVDKATADNAGLMCYLCAWGFRGTEICTSLIPAAVAEKPSDIVHLIRYVAVCEMRLPSGGKIVVNSGNLCEAGKYLHEAFPDAKKAFIVTNSQIADHKALVRAVEDLIGEQLRPEITDGMNYTEIMKKTCIDAGFDTEICLLAPEDEKSKSLETVERIAYVADRFGMHRGDVFVSLGGGVICDTVGLCAALYMRGAGLCHIPTTIIAQCDAAVGGKVAVNFDGMKNRLGTFYHPSLVYVDTDFFRTLPIKERRAGMAEIIKYGAIADSGLFSEVEKEVLLSYPSIIMRCLQIKCAVVAEDERDTGKRHILNFGHTVGHAIEEYSNGKYSHGEAVAIGMCAMARVGEKLGITEKGTAKRIKKVCRLFQLPTCYDDANYVKYLTGDKKCDGEYIDAVFLTKIGECITKKITAQELEDLLLRWT